MEPLDTVTVAPGALITIAREATLSVRGVARMGSTPGGVGQWLRRTSHTSGVRLNVQDNTAEIAIYIVLKPDTDMRAVGREVQREVARAFRDIAGLDIQTVDIHIENVDFNPSPSPS